MVPGLFGQSAHACISFTHILRLDESDPEGVEASDGVNLIYNDCVDISTCLCVFASAPR